MNNKLRLSNLYKIYNRLDSARELIESSCDESMRDSVEALMRDVSNLVNEITCPPTIADCLNHPMDDGTAGKYYFGDGFEIQLFYPNNSNRVRVWDYKGNVQITLPSSVTVDEARNILASVS